MPHTRRSPPGHDGSGRPGSRTAADDDRADRADRGAKSSTRRPRLRVTTRDRLEHGHGGDDPARPLRAPRGSTPGQRHHARRRRLPRPRAPWISTPWLFA